MTQNRRITTAIVTLVILFSQLTLQPQAKQLKDSANKPKYEIDFSLDQYYSPFMGNEIIGNFNNLVTWFEGNNKGYSKKYYAAETIIETSSALVSAITQHEIFGHGYRLRELGYTPSGYEIRLLSGVTYYNGWFSNRIECINFSLGGHEANKIAAEETSSKFLVNEGLTNFDEKYYLFNKLSLFQEYLLILNYNNWDFTVRTDTAKYLGNLNNILDENHQIELRKFVLTFLDLADPLVFAPIYTLFTGKDLPFLEFGPVKYLPSFGTLMTPYGLEAKLDNYFKVNDFPFIVSLRGGSNGGNNSMGAKFEAPYIYINKNANMNAAISLWRQPEINEDKFPYPPQNIGGSIKVGGLYYLTDKFGVKGTINLKSSGYEPGESLRATARFNAGIKIKL
jgi:hypothetical protein